MMKKELYKTCEICGLTTEEVLVRHHIHSRSKGGHNGEINIANICSNCHSLVHHGLIVLEGRFNSTSGNILVFRKWNEPFIITEKSPEIWLYPNAKVKKLI